MSARRRRRDGTRAAVAAFGGCSRSAGAGSATRRAVSDDAFKHSGQSVRRALTDDTVRFRIRFINRAAIISHHLADDVRLNADDRPMSAAALKSAVGTADVLVPTVTDRISPSSAATMRVAAHAPLLAARSIA